MAPGDVFEADRCTDVHYVDTGMFGTGGYGVAYVVDAERPAFVETGIGTHHERVLDALDAVGVDREAVETIAVTHIHLDHAGGAGFLAEACPNADVYVHEIGARHLVDPSKLVAGTREAVGEQWREYTEPRPVPSDRMVELTDGDEIDLGDRTLTAHGAPGHAPHQVVFHDDLDDAVFTGDAAGVYLPHHGDVHETSPPPNFDLPGCIEDVEMLRGLDPEVLLYTHFGQGPEDVDAALREYADVLTGWVERIEAKYEELGDPEAVQRYFADRVDTADVWGTWKAEQETMMNVRGVLRYLETREDGS